MVWLLLASRNFSFEGMAGVFQREQPVPGFLDLGVRGPAHKLLAGTEFPE